MIIDGKKIAEEILSELSIRVRALDFKPVLCDILIGNDLVSLSFVKVKQRVAEKVGIEFKLIHLPEISTNDIVIAAIKDAQAIKSLCGLIIQLPIPVDLDKNLILSAISEDVDVDLLKPKSAIEFYSNSSLTMIPPTAGAIMHILETLPINLNEQKIIIVGQGELVGKPVAQLFYLKGLKADIIDIYTENAEEKMRTGTVIVSGTGKPGLINADKVSEGVVIIDAGTSESGGSIKGDVDFADKDIVAKAKYITPVPGGVGPVTVAMLLSNVIKVAESKGNP